MSQTLDLKRINHHGWNMLQSERLGVGPYFQNTLQHRINKKLATNIVVCGEAGIGKSYAAIDIARILEGLTPSGQDRFKVEQIVFDYSSFMELVLKLKAGKIIIFDEPSYALSKREWYKQLNQALCQTIESFRFKIHPLILPVINKSLLDKTVRDHLLQFQIVVHDRGHATVYRLRPSQFIEKIYHERFCELIYRRADSDKCQRESCLDCPQLMTCNLFYAQYERRKASIQESRYEQAKESAAHTETAMKTLSELEELANSCRDKWLIDGKVHVQKLRIALQETQSASISLNKAYQLKALLETHNPEFADS